MARRNILTTGILMALTLPPLHAATRVPVLKFTDYKLANGLRVILSRDTSAPVIGINIGFNVGSFVEPVGKTGYAHLFEHMMFQGSAHAPKGVYDIVVTNNGGYDNAGTGQDVTEYEDSAPANQLEPILFLEADRMAALNVTQENVDNQRQVVKEERRLRMDNQPYGKVYETLLLNAYQNFGYQHDTIGSMADLDAASLEDVQHFFNTYYAPNNAALAIVGDFDVSEAKALIQKYFGGIPRGPAPPFPSLAEPPQTAEKRVDLKDPLAPLPSYVAGYHMPSGTDPDFPALSVLATVLTGGKSARMNQALVEKQKVCTAVGAGAEAQRGPALFTIGLDFAPGQSVEKAEAAMDAQIALVQKNGVTTAEMEKARTQALRSAISSQRSSLGRATNLAVNAAVFGDPNRVNTDLVKFNKVTAADVQRVARKYLQRHNRTVVITVPDPSAAPKGESTE